MQGLGFEKGISGKFQTTKDEGAVRESELDIQMVAKTKGFWFVEFRRCSFSMLLNHASVDHPNEQ